MSELSRANSIYSVPLSQRQRKVYIDGEEYLGDYIIKEMFYNSTIQVMTPELIKNKVQGDKIVAVRCMVIQDLVIPAAQRPYTIFQLIATNQRNNFNSKGQQSQIIGYAYYQKEKDFWVLDSQQFLQDSFYSLNIQIQKLDRTTGLGVAYTFPNDQQSYIYADIEISYNFL